VVEASDDGQPIETRLLVRSRTLRYVLIGAGCISLGLGLLGIPLPVLPTTPFLLLSAACFARSSPRLLRWLMNNRLFGRYLRNYCEKKGIPVRVKVYTLVLLWIVIGGSAFLAIDRWWLRIVLLIVAVGVTVHVLRMPTYRITS
jgi:uncharacterized membrane protein YbaN (DUF454 family)